MLKISYFGDLVSPIYMITPDFSGRHVRNQPAFDHQTTKAKQPPRTPESKRHNRSRQKGHILIEKHGHERHASGEKSPHARRREIHKNLHTQTPSSSPTKQHFELAQELHNVSGNLGLCYEELKGRYMREIAKDVGLNTVDSGMFLGHFNSQILTRKTY